MFKNHWKFGLYFDFTRNINETAVNEEIAALNKELMFKEIVLSTDKNLITTPYCLIITEGKSDWKHFKKALEILNIHMAFNFNEYENTMGWSTLLKMCEYYSIIPQEKK